jgi:D-lyxose ketol-isomerase
MGFHLPPFAYITPDKWRSLGSEWDEVRDNKLGWDITDYGHGKFSKSVNALRFGTGTTGTRVTEAFARRF